MKLTLKTDYAFRVLIYLQGKEKATIQEVADHYNVKKNHLSVVVNKLSELGYLDSVPGPKGGISLKPKALKVKLSSIVQELEEIELVECFREGNNNCRLNPRCKLKGILKKASNRFLEELGNYTIEDIGQ
ncbi:MAG: Rrf2 family transcriptional regulator [Deltaproteobacteria bacterium]|nr:MAG: Rrf2 family transcriptional regulator [Deltaproteobacteria bacterium]